MLTLSGSGIRHSGTLGTFWDTSAFLIQEPVGTTVTITLQSQDDLAFAVYDSLGDTVLEVDDYSSGAETGTLTVEYDEPYFVVVNQWEEGASTFTISATHTLIPIPDPDDGRSLRVGQLIQGSLDYPGDVDTYTIHLSSAQRVQMTTTSFTLDTFMAADYFGAVDTEIIIDDNSGGGLFGSDAQIVYRAPHTGEFIVVVTENYYETGGYTLAVSRADPSLQLTSTTRDSLFDDSDYVPVPITGFGPDELRRAFSSLPTSFEELDLAAEDLSATDLGLDDFVDYGVAYATDIPFQVLAAYSGRVDEETALGVEFLSLAPELVLSVITSDEEGINDSGNLDVQSIGESAVGYWFEVEGDGIEIVVDMIIFTRGDYIGLIYMFSFPNTSLSISPQEAAQILDSAFVEYLLDQ